MNSFTRTITSVGMTEALVYKGNTYVKRYEKDDSGYHGLDKSWEYETDLPDDVVEALEDGDQLVIMDALE
ncbi:hypothetical protein [Paenibacillus alba]|uniref:Uncharacterized protein n=1 Tax=Paenibacillus alba TaxID=1197127 RepID=A0ABU6FX58_9BACL|nr:hypothetical protein [Paenibacillus alba]MEC0225925.1 hypothetical protein [Paenibacillus alba]